MIKITFMSESELDGAIQEGRFCKSHQDTTEEMDDRQYDLGRSLETLLREKHGKENICVDDNVWKANILRAEVTDKVINTTFILFLLEFLRQQAEEYCIGVPVFESLAAQGDSNFGNYLGRILLNRQEIVIETAIKPMWEKRVSGIEQL